MQIGNLFGQKEKEKIKLTNVKYKKFDPAIIFVQVKYFHLCNNFF